MKERKKSTQKEIWASETGDSDLFPGMSGGGDCWADRGVLQRRGFPLIARKSLHPTRMHPRLGIPMISFQLKPWLLAKKEILWCCARALPTLTIYVYLLYGANITPCGAPTHLLHVCFAKLCVCLSGVVCLYVRLLVLCVIECAGMFCSGPTTVEFEFLKVPCWEGYVANNLDGFCLHGHPGPEMPYPTQACGAPFRSVAPSLVRETCLLELVARGYRPAHRDLWKHCRLFSPTWRRSAIISMWATVQDSLLGPKPLIRIPIYRPTWRNFWPRRIREVHLCILNRPEFAKRGKLFVDPEFPKEAWLILLI